MNDKVWDDACKEIPRRNRMDQWCPAEHAIQEAINRVEEAGAHPLLTDAVNLLVQAKSKVADFVELPRNSPLTPFGEALLLLKSMERAMAKCPLRDEATEFLEKYDVNGPSHSLRYNPINGG